MHEGAEMAISKVVIPAAGLGTRFLPETKAVPKEMLPILNKPAIQYIVEEAAQSGIKLFLMVTSKEKNAIANHFDASLELDLFLKEHGKQALTAGLDKLIRNVQFTYIRQPEPLGLGHAIYMARHSISKEYFGVMLPDDIIVSQNAGLAQLIAVAQQEKASVIAVQEVPLEKTASYGVISIRKQITPNLFQINNLIEKPNPKDAPSNLAIVGRYVLSHKIFDSLDAIKPYATDELQLTDAIAHMLNNGEKVFAYKIQGHRYDVGTPMGLIKANIGIGLQHPEYSSEIKKMFQTNFIDVLAGDL
jgi:UTP--glucose-1-phosphate uridylyltransferase